MVTDRERPRPLMAPDAPGGAATAGQAGKQTGPHADLARINEKLAQNPRDPGLLGRKAELLLDLGKVPEAQTTINKALKRAGGSAQAGMWGIAARAAYSANKFDDAIRICQEGLAKAPAWPDLHAFLGGALRAKGQVKEAIPHLERALNLNPFRRAYRTILGLALEQAGELDRAEAVYRQALVSDGEFVDAALNLANLLQARKKLPDALAAYRRTLQIAGHQPHIYANMGALFRKMEDYEAAHTAYKRSMILKPFDPGVYYNQGNLRRAEDRLDEADVSYRRSLVCRPNSAEVHWNRSLALLAAGDLDRGFREYEWRWDYKEFPSKRRHFKQPMWDGQPLKNKTLLVHTEQGVGDVLQFLRFMPMLRERLGEGRLVLEAHDTLLSLLEGFPGVDQLVERFAPLPKFDVHLPLLSAPLVLGVKTLDDLPTEVPYLPIPDGPDVPLPEADPDRLKVGFVWGGNPMFSSDADRSTVIDHYMPLFDMPGVQWFCLQKGDREPEVAAAPDSVVRVNERLKNFRDTAVVMRKLDLVVSTCTSVCHLSGALGVPTVVLLSRNPDWRWLAVRNDSPWYPSAKLIRQPELRDWPSVFAELRRDLERRVAARAAPAGTP